MSELKWAENKMPKSDDKNLPIMSIEEVKKAKAFHKSFPQYTQTPLSELKEMAKYLGLGTIKVKDESYRFGLNAFKVLGGSYSMAKYIAQKMGKDEATNGSNRRNSAEISVFIRRFPDGACCRSRQS